MPRSEKKDNSRQNLDHLVGKICKAQTKYNGSINSAPEVVGTVVFSCNGNGDKYAIMVGEKRYYFRENTLEEEKCQ